MRRRATRAAAVGAAVFALLGTRAPAATAEESPPIFFGGNCLPEGVEHAAVLRMLRAELAPVPVLQLASAGAAVGNEPVVLGLERCGPASVTIVLWLGRERRERAVDLSDTAPDDRTRTLALVLAETRVDPTVSRATEPGPIPWAMLPPPAPPSPPPTAPPAPSAPPVEVKTGEIAPDVATDVDDSPSTAGTRSRAPWQLRANIAVRITTTVPTLAGGAGIGLAWKRFGVSANFYGSHASGSLGSANLWLPAASGFIDVAQWSSLRLRTALELGVAIAQGAGTATGVTSRTERALHLGGYAGIFGIWPLDRSLDFEGGAGLGYASSLDAGENGTTIVTLGGLFFASEVGVRF